MFHRNSTGFDENNKYIHSMYRSESKRNEINTHMFVAQQQWRPATQKKKCFFVDKTNLLDQRVNIARIQMIYICSKRSPKHTCKKFWIHTKKNNNNNKSRTTKKDTYNGQNEWKNGTASTLDSQRTELASVTMIKMINIMLLRWKSCMQTKQKNNA